MDRSEDSYIAAVVLGSALVAFLAWFFGHSKKGQELLEKEMETSDTRIVKDGEVFELTLADAEEDPVPSVVGDGMGRDCVIMAPWGSPIIVRFTPEQWEMIQVLVEMTGDSVEEVVCEVAGDRYHAGGDGLIPPPPWFGSYLRELGLDGRMDNPYDFDEDDDDDDNPYDIPFGDGLF